MLPAFLLRLAAEAYSKVGHTREVFGALTQITLQEAMAKGL